MAKKNPSALSNTKAHQKKKPPRTKVVYVRLTPEEDATLLEKAQRLGQNRSELIRASIFRCKVKDLSPETLEMRKHFIRACGNLNQYMKYLNTYGYGKDSLQKAMDVVDWLHELKEKHVEV